MRSYLIPSTKSNRTWESWPCSVRAMLLCWKHPCSAASENIRVICIFSASLLRLLFTSFRCSSASCMTGCSCSTRSLQAATHPQLQREKERGNVPKGWRVDEAKSSDCHFPDLSVPANEWNHTLEKISCRDRVKAVLGGGNSRAGGTNQVVSPQKCLDTADNWSPLPPHGGGPVSLVSHEPPRIQHRIGLHHALVDVGPGKLCCRLAGLGEECGSHQSRQAKCPRVTHGSSAATLFEEAGGTISQPGEGQTLIGDPQLGLWRRERERELQEQ